MTSEAEILGCEPTEIPEIPGGHCRFAAADQTEYGQSGVPAPQLPNSIRSAVAAVQTRLGAPSLRTRDLHFRETVQI